jgi:hypothetical protein
VTDASFQGLFGEMSGEASYRLISFAAASLATDYLSCSLSFLTIPAMARDASIPLARL